jgi:hypothetical protein
MTDDDLEALALLRADICKLWPPGPVRERWLAWAELVAACVGQAVHGSRRLLGATLTAELHDA